MPAGVATSTANSAEVPMTSAAAAQGLLRNGAAGERAATQISWIRVGNRVSAHSNRNDTPMIAAKLTATSCGLDPRRSCAAAAAQAISKNSSGLGGVLHRK